MQILTWSDLIGVSDWIWPFRFSRTRLKSRKATQDRVLSTHPPTCCNRGVLRFVCFGLKVVPPLRLTSFTTRPASSVMRSFFRLIICSLNGNAEPKSLPYAINSICPVGAADAEQSKVRMADVQA